MLETQSAAEVLEGRPMTEGKFLERPTATCTQRQE